MNLAPSTLSPPYYPARPVNGGPLPKAIRKHGTWRYEPKVNGWRAWVHTPTGRMFNRENQPLSIAQEFAPVLARLREHFLGRDGDAFVFEWLDVEAFERRHNFGRGSLVILDAPDVPGVHDERQERIHQQLVAPGLVQSWPFLNVTPPENALLSFSYGFTDYDTAVPSATDWLPAAGHYRGEDIDGIHTGWRLLQAVNRALGCKTGSELFEGMVAKRADSLYPRQLRSPGQEFPFWMKHRWAF